MVCQMAGTTTQTSGRSSAAADMGPKANGRGTPAPGSRLAEAFEAVERFPVLIESRERVIAASTAETARVGELVGEAQLICNWEAFPDDVANLVHMHPTQDEALGEAHLALAGKPLHAHT